VENYDEHLISLTFEYLEKYFESEEIEKILTENPLTGPKGIRRLLGAIDYAYFSQVYFPEFCEYPSCGFHYEQYEEMKWIEEHSGGVKEAIAAPRESAKSTLWNTFYPINNIVYAKRHYVVLVSDSSTQADNDLKKIKEALEDNPYILEDFGKLQGKSIWRGDAILTKNGVLVMAYGSGMKLRGIKHRHYRPELIILDDIENDEAVRTKEQRKKLLNWFNKVVTKAGSLKTDIITIGTILHYDSLLNNLLERPGYRTKIYKAVIQDSTSDLWNTWEEMYIDLTNPNHVEDAYQFYLDNKQEMNEGVVLIWEAYKDIYYYHKSYIDEGPAAYNSEFQNNPVDPSESWLTYEDITYYDGADGIGLPKLELCTVKMAVDPSLGKSDHGDPSAINVMSRDCNGYMYVVESDGRRRKPDVIINDTIDKQQMFGPDEVYMEAVQFQDLMADDLRRESAKRGVYVNVVTEPKPKGDKHTRIKQLQPLIKNGYIRFSHRQKTLIDQLVCLDAVKHDDEADALQMVSALFTVPVTDFSHSMMPDITGISTRW